MTKRINLAALANFATKPNEGAQVQITAYEPPEFVISGTKARKIAMDYDMTDYGFVNSISGWAGGAFRGYQYLSLLMQQPEYRKISETIAKEATRKWVRLTTKGDDDKADKLDRLTAAMEKFKVRRAFRRMAEMDGFFGRGQLFIDVKTPQGVPAQVEDGEIGTLLLRDPAKITKNSLLGFVPVEPLWTYPGVYDTRNPLSPDYYRPTVWYVMDKAVHASRLLGFVSREVPDILKASYNFGGLSMSQLAEPYVANWLRTRDSVGDIIHSFSLTQLSTDLSAVLTEGDNGGDLFARVDLFNKMRDNRGMMVTNKDTEQIDQFNTPLSSLDKLQAQAQEQMSAVSNIPLIKLLGVTPSGLNASSDGEVRVFYDYIHSYQEDLFRDPLVQVLQVLQLSEFGEIDPDIGFEFEPLWQSDGTEAATIRKTNADTDAAYLDMGVISPEEIRSRLIHDPENVYHSLEEDPAVSDEPGGEPEPEPIVGALPGQPAKPAAPAAPAPKATE